MKLRFDLVKKVFQMRSMLVSMSLELPDGGRIVVYDVGHGPKKPSMDELTRNIYRIDKSGDVVWQITPPHKPDLSYFVKVYYNSKGKLIAYNFTCWEYELDLDSGRAVVHNFLH